MKPLLGLVASIVLAALLSGCHTYSTVESPVVGSTVRAHIPVTVSSALTGDNGRTRTETVQGQLLSGGDTLALAIITRRELGAYREYIQYDTLRLARSQTSLLEVREFSPRRSVLMGSLITVVAGTAAFIAFNAAGGDGTDDGEGPDVPPVTSIVVSPSIVSSLVGFIFR